MILVNSEQSDQIAVADRGLQYGDGLFETIAVLNGQLQFWQHHMARLSEGCGRLGIPEPAIPLLLNEARKAAQGQAKGIIKIIITRGQGGRGYRAPKPAQPSRIVAFHPWPDYPEQMHSDGVVLRYCRTMLGISPALAGLKHLNRLEQVLARSEWDEPEIFEGVMSDVNGHLVEGTMSNIFFVDAWGLHTPDLSYNGVSGIMRGRILAMAEALGMYCQTGRFSHRELNQADELFICNSIIGIVPVRELEGLQKQPGPVAQKIIIELNKLRLDNSQHESV